MGLIGDSSRDTRHFVSPSLVFPISSSLVGLLREEDRLLSLDEASPSIGLFRRGHCLLADVVGDASLWRRYASGRVLLRLAHLRWGLPLPSINLLCLTERVRFSGGVPFRCRYCQFFRDQNTSDQKRI